MMKDTQALLISVESRKGGVGKTPIRLEQRGV